MRCTLFCLVAVSISSPAWADHFVEVVTYQCDQKKGQLSILHQGAYNEAGLALTAHLQDGQWDVSNLFTGPEGVPKTVVRKCSLGDIAYEVEISGLTWNKDNSDESAHVHIVQGSKLLIDVDLEPSPFRTDTDGGFITRITVSPGLAKPEVTSVSQHEFRGF